MSIRLLIVGGVAGGATAAARARRINESAHIILFERGEYISFANCGLPYYIGETIKERDELLLTTPEAFRARYNIDVRTHTRVMRIEPEEKRIHVKDLTTGKLTVETYDKLILSPGAEPIRPSLPGIDSERIFYLRNIPDMDRIKAYVDERKPQSAVVVGGGFIGLEMMENLISRGIRTTVVEMADQVMPPLDVEMAAVVQDHLQTKGAVCHLKDGLRSFSHRNNRLVAATAGGEFECDLAILSIGVRPETELARQAGLAIGASGGIRVNDAMQTSDPHIYAVGDAVEVPHLVTGRPSLAPLAGPANKQGRIAADNAMGRRAVYRGTLGTAIVKVFELTAAVAGVNEKTLTAEGIPFVASYTHSGSNASYYPGSTPMAVKLLFAPGTGRLFGAQIVGFSGVDKRIDVLATAIRGNMTVYDLEELELAYAPPYSSAKDPVNIAGFVAANILKGDLEKIDWRELGEYDPRTEVLMDLRYPSEIEEKGAVEGAVRIPVDRLRSRLDRLDKTKRYILFCAVGMRAYVAYRILTQNGFTARIVSGGYSTYSTAKRYLVK
ncbi:MAG: FAD-dependent oxidoreductase [Thermodesulfobacteriota bacterium]